MFLTSSLANGMFTAKNSLVSSSRVAASRGGRSYTLADVLRRAGELKVKLYGARAGSGLKWGTVIKMSIKCPMMG